MPDSVVEEAAQVARVAPVAWAQRTDRLYLTLQVTECSKPSIRVEPSGRLHFQGLCGPNQLLYACDLQLYGAVDPDESKIAVNPRYLFLVIAKAHTGAHWPRLLKAEGRPPTTVKVDWDKWKDEDEEDKERNAKEFNLGDLDDMSKFDEFAGEELDSEGENDDLYDDDS